MDEDENGRITLRLEKENLLLIDEFLATNPQYRNRSQLCRDAVQSFIETANEGGNAVTLKVPTRILEAIDHLVADGYFNDRQDAVVQALREHFAKAESIKAYQEHKTELQKAKGERVEVKLDGKDEVIPK